MFPMRFSLLVIVLIIVLALRFFFYYQHIISYKNGQEIILEGILQETPTISNHGQRFMIKNEQNQRIYIRTNLKEIYHYGDRLAIQGLLQVNKNDKGATFFNLNYPKITLLPSSKNPMSEASTFVRIKISKLIEETLPPVSASLMMGILFGAKENFPDDFYQKLQLTGVLHVIAASGMNVSFFTGAVMFSLGSFLKRQVAIFLSIIAVIFYSFLVGFDPSILRASLMAILAFTASFFGRQAFSILTLFTTGYLLLLWKPSFLFDVGFQLSFMATLGIILINPIFGRLGAPLRQGSAGQGLGEDFKTTVSAQIATFPILLGTFGKVGILGILVNMFVLWTVPILMLLGSLGVLAGLIFEPFGKLFLLLSLPFVLYFEKVVEFFGSFGWSLSLDSFPWQMGVGYYLVLISIIIFTKKLKVQN